MTEKYKFVSREGDKWASILIDSGKYNGVIYQYGKVSVPKEENEDGNMPLVFKYTIVEFNSHTDESLKETEEFTTTIGDILVSILDEQLEKDNLEYADD
mgnify:FL=1|jgi:hypothetical protein|tara:strand:- start:131 stop:427 length:297 start_codon:yes stop_codon:yes gene_type:complete